MSQATIDEWEKDTPSKLPERIGPKKKTSKHSRAHWQEYFKRTKTNKKPRIKRMKKSAEFTDAQKDKALLGTAALGGGGIGIHLARKALAKQDSLRGSLGSAAHNVNLRKHLPAIREQLAKVKPYTSKLKLGLGGALLGGTLGYGALKLRDRFNKNETEKTAGSTDMKKTAGIFGGISMPGPSERGRAMASQVFKKVKKMDIPPIIPDVKKPILKLIEGLKKAASYNSMSPYFMAGFEKKAGLIIISGNHWKDQLKKGGIGLGAGGALGALAGAAYGAATKQPMGKAIGIGAGAGAGLGGTIGFHAPLFQKKKEET